MIIIVVYCKCQLYGAANEAGSSYTYGSCNLLATATYGAGQTWLNNV